MINVVRIKKWKDDMAAGVVLSRTPFGMSCQGCTAWKQKCNLPELRREHAALRPPSKQKLEDAGAREELEQAGYRTNAVGEETLKKEKVRLGAVEVVILWKKKTVVTP